LDHRHQRLLGHLPRLEDRAAQRIGGKYEPCRSLGVGSAAPNELQPTEPGVERAVAVAVPVGLRSAERSWRAAPIRPSTSVSSERSTRSLRLHRSGRQEAAEAGAAARPRRRPAGSRRRRPSPAAPSVASLVRSDEAGPVLVTWPAMEPASED
jgi:hypothetical protein